MPDAEYVGTELELFSQARNWKRYWSSLVRRYIRGNVLEVGAGIGANVPLLSDSADRWLCLEPDVRLAQELRQSFAAGSLSHEVLCGHLQDIEAAGQFDAILYIDVLEHIRDDVKELADATARLKPGGHLIVLVPAHQWLFTPFDRAIGHVRRYSTKMLLSSAPKTLQVERAGYLDSVGLFASLGNKLLLQRSMPTPRQIGLWDGLMIPISRSLDGILRYRAGKSLLVVWRKV